MSIEAMVHVLSIKVGGEGKRKLVLLGYANHAHRDGTNAWCSIKTVADYAECSERTAQRHVGDLLKAGFIREGNQLAPIGTSTKPANQLPIVYDIAMDEPTREMWQVAYTPGRRERFAEAGAEGGRRAAENRHRGDSVTPLYGADPSNETSQVKGGDSVTPSENADDRGDKFGTAGVTETLFGGDTITSPEPSLEPSLNRPTADATTSHLPRGRHAADRSRPRRTRAHRTAEDQALFEQASDIADRWWKHRQEGGVVVGDRFVGLRDSIVLAALRAGATVRQVENALVACNTTFPSVPQFEKALRGELPNGHHNGNYQPPRVNFDDNAYGSGYDAPRSA